MLGNRGNLKRKDLWCCLLHTSVAFAMLTIVDRAAAKYDDSLNPDQAAAKTPLTVDLNFQKPFYRPLEPIQVAVRITNVGSQPLFVRPFVSDYHDFRFEVDRLEGGRSLRVPATRFGDQQIDHIAGWPVNSSRTGIEMKPGESYETSLVVNLVADMTLSASYSITAVVRYSSQGWLSPFPLPGNEKVEQVARSTSVKVEVQGAPTITDRHGPTVAVSNRGKPLLQVEMSFSKVTYRPLEPMKALILLKNVGNQAVYLPSYRNPYQNVAVAADLLGPTQEHAPHTYYHEQYIAHAQGDSSLYTLRLEPGQVRRVVLVINQVVDLTATGQYSVTASVRYSMHANLDPKSTKEVSSSPIMVQTE